MSVHRGANRGSIVGPEKVHSSGQGRMIWSLKSSIQPPSSQGGVPAQTGFHSGGLCQEVHNVREFHTMGVRGIHV